MPYKLSENGLCVHKENADKSLGAVVKCHDTHEQAVKHLRALYANVPEAKEIAAWGLSNEAASSVGTLRTLFSGKVHDAMTTVTDQLTMRGYLSQEQNKVITDIKGAMLKLFNETIPSDLAETPILPETLDEIASKEIGISELITDSVSVKEVNGEYVLAMFTSSSFEDRDCQTVTQKAHEQDINRMWQRGEFETLDYWHIHPLVFKETDDLSGLPPTVRENGLIIGQSIYEAMAGRIRVSLFKFHSKELGSFFARHADEYSGSLLFVHPKSEPDASGAFWNIHTVSCALMPRHRVSNVAPLVGRTAIQEL